MQISRATLTFIQTRHESAFGQGASLDSATSNNESYCEATARATDRAEGSLHTQHDTHDGYFGRRSTHTAASATATDKSSVVGSVIGFCVCEHGSSVGR